VKLADTPTVRFLFIPMNRADTGRRPGPAAMISRGIRQSAPVTVGVRIGGSWA